MFFKEIIYLDSADSTNRILKNGDYADRTLIYTFNQTNGRGRSGKDWFTGANKGIALSVLLKNDFADLQSIWLVFCCSIALVELLNEFSIDGCWIKWPNDIYVGKKKISGILTESVWSAGKNEKTIIGIGFNVNEKIDDIYGYNKNATSILSETGIEFDLKFIVNKYIDNLSHWLGILIDDKSVESIKEKWLFYSNIIGREVIWSDAGQIFEAVVMDIGTDSSLIIKLNSGEIIQVVSGDVILKENFYA